MASKQGSSEPNILACSDDVEPESQPTFERVDGKMSEAEHDHVLVNAFARNKLTLEVRNSGYFLAFTAFSVRTAAWSYLKLYEESKQSAARIVELEDTIALQGRQKMDTFVAFTERIAELEAENQKLRGSARDLLREIKVSNRMGARHACIEVDNAVNGGKS